MYLIVVGVVSRSPTLSHHLGRGAASATLHQGRGPKDRAKATMGRGRSRAGLHHG